MDNVTATKNVWDKVQATGDYQPFFDSLADDVVMSATIPAGTPISGEFRGKQAVLDYFMDPDAIAEFQPFEKPLEYFTNENQDRVIILGEETFRFKKTGHVAQTAYAWVQDFRDGKVTRIHVIEDLSSFVDAYRSLST
ncbi:MAG TPA: nuclear transport factor 2 family protein, partial [Nonomuraea sp.]|nr:nuclear transport factor 2 family protein [Nonomuraea sp.]